MLLRVFALFILLGTTAGWVDVQPVPVIELPPADAELDRGFTMIVGVRELSDGRVLLSDWREGKLVIADSALGDFTAVSREGEGPGEFVKPGWLYPLADDSTLFTDATLRRWMILHEDRPVRTIARAEPLPRFMDPILDGVDTLGRVLGIKRRVEADTVSLVLATRSTEIFDTLAMLRGAGPAGNTVSGRGAPNGRSYVMNPFAAADQAHLFPDGWIAIARLEPFVVDWLTPDGGRVRGQPLPYNPPPVDEDERCFALRYTGRACGDVMVHGGWPELVPPFRITNDRPTGFGPGTSSLFATPEGELLIRLTETEEHPNTRYLRVDRTGAATGLLTLGPGETIVGFGEEHVYVQATDQWDLQWLRRHPWPESQRDQPPPG